MKRVIAVSILIVAVATTATAAPTTYGGITFVDGDVSFADAVVSYVPGLDVGPGWDDANTALGPPQLTSADDTAASLGEGGMLILQFLDNSLTTSGDSTADLHIFETGSVVEAFNTAISTDGTTWIDLGDVSGQPTSIDIDAYAGVVPGTKYSYVRLMDVDPRETFFPYGEADIDAVGAISSDSPVVPAPGAILLGSLVSLVGWLRRHRTL